jgi:streptogramin lyase
MSRSFLIRSPMSHCAACLAIAVVGGCADANQDPDDVVSDDAGFANAGAGQGGEVDAASPRLDGGAVGAPSLDASVVNDGGAGAPAATLCPFPAQPTPTGPWLHVIAGRMESCEAANGPALGARFCGISGLELVDEILYVSEPSRIRALDLTSGVVRTVTADPLPDSITYPDFTDLTSDDGGLLYVSDSSNSLIHQLDPTTGEMTTLVDLAPYGFGGFAVLPSAIISDRQGGLWVADFNATTLRHVDIASAAVDPALATEVKTMTVDSDGELYFTSDRVIQWLDQRGPVGIPLFDTEQVFGEGATRFSGLGAAALDSDGLMWVSAFDWFGSVNGIHVAGNVRTAERVDLTVSLDPAPLDTPIDMVFDTSGDLIIGTETQIHRVDPVSGETTTLAGSGCEPQPPKGSDDGVGPEASFDSPWDLATDGEIAYVLDVGNSTIRRIDLTSNEVTTLAGMPGERGLSDGTGSAARFESSYQLALADDGNLYATGLDGVVRRVDPNTREVTTLAGAPGITTATVDGFGTQARITAVEAMTADGDGHLYFSEHGLEGDERRLRRVTLATGEVSTLTDLVDADGLPVQFYAIESMRSDGQGNLYIGDFRTLRRLALADGVVTDVIGGQANGNVDGVGPAASFDGFVDLAFDGSDTLYLVTFNLVRKIDLNTLEVSTEVGVADLVEVRPGPLPGALFNPKGLAVLPAGDLLLVDSAAAVILRVDFDGPN